MVVDLLPLYVSVQCFMSDVGKFFGLLHNLKPIIHVPLNYGWSCYDILSVLLRIRVVGFVLQKLFTR